MIEIIKADWENCRFQNENLIKMNLMQIDQANKIIELCDEKIKEFPDEDK